MPAHFCLPSAFCVIVEMLKVIAEGLTSSNVGLNAGSEALRVVGVARVAGVEGGAVGRGDGLGNAPAVPFCGVVPGFEAAPMGGVAELYAVLLPLS